MRAPSLLFVVSLFAACGGGGSIRSFKPITGAPRVVRALSFDANGGVMVVGGSSMASLQIQRPAGPRDPAWQVAANVPVSTSVEGRLFSQGKDRWAAIGASVYHLDDTASFKWSQVPVPMGALQILGVDATGAVYASQPQSVVRWAPGDASWTPLPDSASAIGVDSVVASDGTLYGTWLSAGVLRVTRQGTTKAVDCSTPDLGGCNTRLAYLTLDGADNLYFLLCPFTLDGRWAYELPKGASAPKRLAPLPAKYLYCRSLQALGDGTLILHATTDNTLTASAALFRLAPGSGAFEKLTADDPDNYVEVTDIATHYVARDATTVYGYGDGAFASGVVQSQP